jgi:hypothetical protein
VVQESTLVCAGGDDRTSISRSQRGRDRCSGHGVAQPASQLRCGWRARLTLGGWCDVSHTWGIEGDLFSLGQQSTGFSVYDHSGNGSLVINEPVIGAPYSTQVSAPGVETGGVAVSSTSQFWGGGINGLYNLMRRDGWTVNLMGGFRYLQLNEQINIVANSGLFTTTTYTDNMGNTLATAPPGSTVASDRPFRYAKRFLRWTGRCQVSIYV